MRATTGILLLALGGCYGNADVGRAGARLVPLVASGELELSDPVAARAFALEADGREGELVSCLAGGERRAARLLGVPGETATRVPEGVREVRFWVSEPVARGAVPSGCRVELEASWDAGGEPQRVSAPAREDASGGWLSFRLVTKPLPRPTLLSVRARATPPCAEVGLVLAVTEVMPVVPSRLEKRPSLLLVVLGGPSAASFDCTTESPRAWPKLHNRWCVRGVSFAEAFAASTDPSRAVTALLTGSAAGPEPGVGTLAALLQREGYVTFAAAPASLRGPGWVGFDERVEVGPGEPLLAARVLVDRALVFLEERPLQPFFLAVALPPAPRGTAQALDRELDRLLDHLVKRRLESRTAVVVTGVGEGGADPFHVPLVLVPPSRGGVPPALTGTSELASTGDVFATALALTGTPVPTASRSRDLTWALEQSTGLGRMVVVSESCRGDVPPRCTPAATTTHLRGARDGARLQFAPRAGVPGQPSGAEEALLLRALAAPADVP